MIQWRLSWQKFKLFTSGTNQSWILTANVCVTKKTLKIMRKSDAIFLQSRNPKITPVSNGPHIQPPKLDHFIIYSSLRKPRSRIRHLFCDHCIRRTGRTKNPKSNKVIRYRLHFAKSSAITYILGRYPTCRVFLYFITVNRKVIDFLLVKLCRNSEFQ